MGMTEHDRVLDAFRNCITEHKCKDCLWAECDEVYNRRIEIPVDLALAVMRMLTIDAISVEWLENHKMKYYEDWGVLPVSVIEVLNIWRKEQEAKNG